MVGFGEAIGLFYKNYVKFDGRATRAEYWWTALYQILVYTALVVAFVMTVGMGSYEDTTGMPGSGWALMSAGLIFMLINFLPGLSIQVRRFHDLDQSGWLVLVFIIVNAVIGVAFLAQLIWFAMRGTEGSNKYGPDPFQPHAEVFG